MSHEAAPFASRLGRVFTIREATPDDAEALIAFVREVDTESTFLSREPGEFDATVVAERMFIKQTVSSPNALFLLALDGDRVMGALDFHGGKRARTRHAGEFGLSVRREAWGQGLGGHLLDRLIAWGRAHPSLRKIKLRVHAENLAAIRLYQARGFVEEGRLRAELHVDGAWIDVLMMALCV